VPGAASLQIVEALLATLRNSRRGDPTKALAWLVDELGATGTCLLEHAPGREPVVLGVAGLIQDIAAQPAFQQIVRHPHDTASGSWAAHRDGTPGYWLATMPRGGAASLMLIVWGELGDVPDFEPLLRSLLGLFDRFLSEATPPDRASVAERPLVFPQGYVAGASPALRELYRQMQPLLQGDLPVLIVGETGVGKEFVARTLHASSRRVAGPFVAINCAAIPAELLEAELFGVVKGAATGVSERAGKLQQADGGTLFLDEIGDMSTDLQAKLLRALQEREVMPVGGAAVRIDIRVIAATNSDLLQRIQEHRFRQDLYYRVAGFVLEVPPLRGRQGHIPQLVEDFIQAFSRETGKVVRGVTIDALRALADYPWPGNVRELEHEVRRLVYTCPGGEAIEVHMLAERIRKPRGAEAPPPTAPRFAGESLVIEDHVLQLERQLIEEALRRSGGNRTEAARLLGISRNGLALKIDRLRLAEPEPPGR
jgi:DNA-binding NtrC family response regulator